MFKDESPGILSIFVDAALLRMLFRLKVHSFV
jgi:hypothetical protein